TTQVRTSTSLLHWYCPKNSLRTNTKSSCATLSGTATIAMCLTTSWTRCTAPSCTSSHTAWQPVPAQPSSSSRTPNTGSRSKRSSNAMSTSTGPNSPTPASTGHVLTFPIRKAVVPEAALESQPLPRPCTITSRPCPSDRTSVV